MCPNSSRVTSSLSPPTRLGLVDYLFLPSQAIPSMKPDSEACHTSMSCGKVSEVVSRECMTSWWRDLTPDYYKKPHWFAAGIAVLSQLASTVSIMLNLRLPLVRIKIFKFSSLDIRVGWFNSSGIRIKAMNKIRYQIGSQKANKMVCLTHSSKAKYWNLNH